VFLFEPLALAVNLQASAVDQEMQWALRGQSASAKPSGTTALAQGCMIGDGNIDRQYVGDRSQQALGLTQRLMEHQAESRARLDGQCRYFGVGILWRRLSLNVYGMGSSRANAHRS
jgi:hypothetical protein